MPHLLAGLVLQYRASILSSVGIGAGFLTFCIAIQFFSGAWHAAFTAYPDEPAHFVGAVMVRDWLVSGQWSTPFGFARHYYEHYPYFALGYWPPLFSLVTGLCMLIAGVGRQQALLIPAICAAGTGLLICHFVRQRAGIVIGLCAGILYLSLSEVCRWVSAVMVDHMTAFLCLAVAACLVRYLERPTLWRGILCAAVCSCAILSKYSAAYVAVLPVLALVLLRRFELLRSPGFLVQLLVIAVVAGPWAFWTKGLSFYGLPSAPSVTTLARVWRFVAATFGLFPPPIMALVILGLAVLLFRPILWREDVVVLCLLIAGHLGLLIYSPVKMAEPRYLLAPAAALLVMSFAGWSQVRELWVPEGRWGNVVRLAVAGLTLIFAFSQLSRLTPAPRNQIGDIVALIVSDPARAAELVVVPPLFEGPIVAEFVAQTRNRPDHSLLRPSKVLSTSDWFGRKYRSHYASSEEMMMYFEKHQVSLIIWNECPAARTLPHARVMGEMLKDYAPAWRRVMSLAAADRELPDWSVYEYAGEPLPTN